ncbi:YkvA family protein [Paenibacillus chondroitinus]|uniref:YkvA family protein n=1 Tax=Paenibacillus chondroitinus TaxID=59842 RepID=A0ABU6DNH4_9BACL|nr:MULTISPECIES: YkvA family protein [Paenibacillus]MCY9660574.1 YkvA family protein [Paenibacillus anseongense]MEB4799334.1 YkvA family protein [Paenibacillus chondroitinus]
MNKVATTLIDKLKHQVRILKQNIIALYLSYKDPRVPWYAKWIAICVVAYACSPIDLIPDFIPVLGYLDDLILVPLGVTLALRFIPKPILEEYREKAKELGKKKPKNWLVGALFIAIWILCAVWIGIMAYKMMRP